MSESNNIEINEIKTTEATEIKPKRKYKKRKDIGMKREIRTPWRHKPDGTYNNTPISESYFRDYYHKNLSSTTMCPFCNKERGAVNLSRHQKSKNCKKMQALKE